MYNVKKHIYIYIYIYIHCSLHVFRKPQSTVHHRPRHTELFVFKLWLSNATRLRLL